MSHSFQFVICCIVLSTYSVANKNHKCKKVTYICAYLIKHYAIKTYGGVDVYIHVS
jgi:hypothetical protein